MRAALLLVAMGLACCAVALNPVLAHADERVTLEAGFSPDRLGAPTTIQFGFRVSSSVAGAIPSPLIGIDLYLPAGLGLGTSTLGLAVCQPARLLALGLAGCPANSRVGYGSALGELMVEGAVIDEAATVQSVLGPNINQHEQVLFYVESTEPVQTELVFPSELLSSSSPAFSAHLHTSIPLVTGWVNGPDVSVTRLSSTLGPRGLTYLRHVHGYIVPFHPRGISVPSRCPRGGGFPFVAYLHFLDGSVVQAQRVVPCSGA